MQISDSVKEWTERGRPGDLLRLVRARDQMSLPCTNRQVNEWRTEHGEVYARAFSENGLHWIEWVRVGTFLFSDDTREVQVWPVPTVDYETVRKAFYLFQPIILQGLGWQTLHASAALCPAGVIAFCGHGRAGKSTL